MLNPQDQNIEMTIMVSKGDYYGDWKQVSILAVDEFSDRTLILSLDIFHEI